MTAKPFDLSGKVAIVTGGNGGIGLGMARGLAQAGAAIAVVGRNEAKSAAGDDGDLAGEVEGFCCHGCCPFLQDGWSAAIPINYSA